jgi:hypothetical protein
MEKPKLRVVFFEDKKVLSYFFLERTESLRVIKILKILPKLKEWTPISKIARMINSKNPSTSSAIQKLAGAQYLDVMLPTGRKVIARRPILLVQKKQFNTRNNLIKQKYLRATVCVRGYGSKLSLEG